MKLLTVFLLTTLATSVFSTNSLPMTIKQDSNQYQQCDAFTLRYGYILKIAEVGWYAPDCTTSGPILEANDKLIRFHYFKNISADFFKLSAEEYFLLNINSEEQRASLKQPLINFNSSYTDIKAGEYFDLVYTNDSNLSLYKNQQLLSMTKNKLLSKNYFNIWFGKKPAIEKLKKAFQTAKK